MKTQRVGTAQTKRKRVLLCVAQSKEGCLKDEEKKKEGLHGAEACPKWTYGVGKELGRSG
jgi:hypothetical protein